jgi:hypothetical protein
MAILQGSEARRAQHPRRAEPLNKIDRYDGGPSDYLERLETGLTECIGCGCLSLDRCKLANPGEPGGFARTRPSLLDVKSPGSWDLKREHAEHSTSTQPESGCAYKIRATRRALGATS